MTSRARQYARRCREQFGDPAPVDQPAPPDTTEASRPEEATAAAPGPEA